MGHPFLFDTNKMSEKQNEAKMSHPPAPPQGAGVWARSLLAPRVFPTPVLFGWRSGKVWVLGSQTENLSRARVISGLSRRLCFLQDLLGAPYILIHPQRLSAKDPPLCLCLGTNPPQVPAGRQEYGRMSGRTDKTDTRYPASRTLQICRSNSIAVRTEFWTCRFHAQPTG